jgi:hypothetical protein
LIAAATGVPVVARYRAFDAQFPGPAAAHRLVFAWRAPREYDDRMSLRRHLRLIGLATAMLFALSVVTTGFMFGAMAAKMSMAAGAEISAHDSDMAAQDGAGDCEKNTACHHDRGMPMACFAHCASTVAVLSDALRLPAVAVARTLVASAVSIAASHHGPPDPYPPKAFV